MKYFFVRIGEWTFLTDACGFIAVIGYLAYTSIPKMVGKEAGARSIVVLPPENLSDNSSQDDFAIP